MSKKMAWTTYRITGYTHQVGTDARATGGVHLHQVCRVRGTYYRRTVDSTGRFSSAGTASPMAEKDGVAAWLAAREQD